MPLFKGDKAHFDRSGIPKIREWNSENIGVEFRIIYHLYIIFIF